MPLVVVTHPIALNNDQEIIKKADSAVEEIVITLIGNSGTAAAQGARK
jgi:hypothetical protein